MREEVTFTDKVVSAALWGVGACWIVPVMGTMMAVNSVVRPDKTDWLGRLYALGQVRLTGSKWRSVVHPDVDPKRPYLFMVNHVNHFDHCTAYSATPHFKQGLESDKHFRYPVYGWFMRQRGTIPVRNASRNKRAELTADMRKEFEVGHSVLAFPEGHRTRDGRVRPFKKGIFLVARDLGIPIVPVAVTGMQHVMRADSLLIRPGHTVTVYCEEPVETADVTDAEIPALMERVRAPMVARVDAYMDAVEQRGRA